jgi:hypothetical protein
MKKTHTLQVILWIFAAVAAGYLAWWLIPRHFKPAAVPGSFEYLSQEAARLNQALPAQLDEKTELMATEAAQAMFIYKYRLVDIAVDRVDHRKFAATAKPQLVKATCTRPETSDEFLKKGVTLRYSYFDKDKKHIATLDVTPADCGF